MKYAEAIGWLYGCQLFGIKLGLDNARRLLREFVEPAAGFASMRVVHVAGTNGKGSVCALADSVCRAAGLRTGLFTSPHLISFRERIRVNGEKISEADAARLLGELRELVAHWEPCPTFFELAVALGLRHFAEREVEVVLLETWMGGRLDATNALESPVVSVISPIALDHREWLGETLAEIAAEKAGIIKGGVPTVSARQSKEALAVLRQAAKRAGSELRLVQERWESSEVGLPGGHQRENAALAVAALAEGGIVISEASISDGLAAVRWRGRFERIPRAGGSELVVDGAHNPAAAEALVETWAEVFPVGTRADVVFGAVEGKDLEGVFRVLAPLTRSMTCVPVDSPRAVDPGVLCAAAARAGIEAGSAPSAAAALEELIAGSRSGPETPALVTGSLFLAGEVLAQLREGGDTFERSTQ
ncbi:MAG: folylpolyglutamate synthase/dihydrofolate synthase family protein [Verrucomicrobiales bacterium]